MLLPGLRSLAPPLLAAPGGFLAGPPPCDFYLFADDDWAAPPQERLADYFIPDMWAALTEQASPSCAPAVAGDHRLKIRHESGSERAARDKTRWGESVAGGTLIPSWNGLSAALAAQEHSN